MTKKSDWGAVSPDSADIARNEFVYICNHDVSTPEKMDRTIRFMIGRLGYYDTHLPANPKHLVKFDVRGQRVTERDMKAIRDQLRKRYHRPDALTVEVVK